MSLFSELKRRNVLRVAAAYAVLSWLLIQVADTLGDTLDLPEWTGKFVVLMLVLGLVPTLIFSWVFELTPEGLKKESQVTPEESVTAHTAKKLDIAVIILLIMAMGLFAFDRMGSGQDRNDGTAVTVPESTASVEPAATPQPAVAEPVDRSVAVLPFSTRSRNEDDVFFSEGVHDDLLTQLAKIADLRVISRTSVMEYRETTKRIPDIARELGVGSIVEGAVQRSGDTVRITAQLIDADSDQHLWADTFDRELTAKNLFAIQTEIATQIASALQATLSPAEKAELNRILTEDLEALEAYQRARRLLLTFEDGVFETASAELEAALKRDPGFAAAHALQAKAYLWKYWNIGNDPQLLDLAWEQIEKARAISPALPEADLAEGFYHYWGHLHYQAALDVLEPALSVYPNDVDLLEVLSWVNRRYGRFDDTKRYLQKAIELDPRQISPLSSLCETLLGLGEYRAADEYLARMRSLDPDEGRTLDAMASMAFFRDGDPATAARYWTLARAEINYADFLLWEAQMAAGLFDEAVETGRRMPDFVIQNYTRLGKQVEGIALHMVGDPGADSVLEEARAQLDSLLQGDPDSGAHAVAQCTVLGALGDAEAAAEMCRRARTHLKTDAFSNAKDGFLFIAGGLAMAGLTDAAFEQLEDVLVTGASVARPLIELNPMLRNLHDDPRWSDLLARARP